MHAHDQLNRPIATKSYNILVCAFKAPHIDIDIIHEFWRKSVNRLHVSSAKALINILISLHTQSDIRLFCVVSPFYYTLSAVIYDIRIGTI